MARKTRKQKLARNRGVAPDGPASSGEPVSDSAAAGPAERTGATDTGTGTGRRVRRLGAARGRRTATPLLDFEVLDPADASIPFDRVPYVPADLRRVTIIALLMLLVVIGAAIIVPRITG